MQERCRSHARLLGILTLGLVGVVSLWTPFLDGRFAARWFHWPGIALTSPVPILVALVAWGFWRGLDRRQDLAPLLYAEALFVLCFLGLGISFFPRIVPPDITIWQAASPDSSLSFLLVGAVVMIPIILTYSAYSYWIFRGKVASGMHYH